MNNTISDWSNFHKRKDYLKTWKKLRKTDISNLLVNVLQQLSVNNKIDN